MRHVQVQSSGCWLWTGQTNAKGYGRFHIGGGRLKVAYLWAWEQVNGQAKPEGTQMDHFLYPDDCLGPSCANPDHVRPVSPRENTLRGGAVSSHNLAKTHCPHGHEYTPENTIRFNGGWRRCRACERVRAKAKWAARKA